MKIYKKIITIMIISTLTVVMFGGCSSKKMASSSNYGTSNGTGMNGTPGIGATGTGTTNNTGIPNQQTNNLASAKELYSNALSTLVMDGTITKNQSDTVIAVITKNMSTSSATTGNTTSAGMNSTTGTDIYGSTGTGADNNTGMYGSNGTGSTNNTGSGVYSEAKPNLSGLSALVTSGVLSKVQASIINQRLQETMRNSRTTLTK